MAGALVTVCVQAEDVDEAAAIAAVRKASSDVGAVVTFTGICRDESGRLAALELEHYPGMAEAEIGRIAEEATARWPLKALTVIHRYGRLAPGDNIVLVAAASSHRQAAFEAASFVMDFLKTSAPFWKKEHPAGGESGRWVEATTEDDAATGRWKPPSS